MKKNKLKIALIIGFTVVVITGVISLTSNTNKEEKMPEQVENKVDDKLPSLVEKDEIKQESVKADNDTEVIPEVNDTEATPELNETTNNNLENETCEIELSSDTEKPLFEKEQNEEKPVTENVVENKEIATPKTEVKSENKTITIAYETIKQEDSNLEQGKTTIKQKGQNGENTITYSVTYIDGKETKRVEISRKVTKEPINEIIKVGTKPITAPIVQKPVITKKEVTVTESVPFKVEERLDATLPQGERKVVTAGQNGIKTIIYEITLSDGKEIDKTIKMSNITTSPVNEIVIVGTKVMDYLDVQIEKDVKLLPSTFTLGREGIERGSIGIFKNGTMVAIYNNGAITIERLLLSVKEQRQLVTFFGETRKHNGRGDDTEKLLHLFDAWQDTTLMEKPKYEGMAYISRTDYIQLMFL